MSALDGLQERKDDFDAAGVRIVAVSPDSVQENQRVARNLELTFPILSDADLALTDALGLRHAGARPGGGDVPRPAVFILTDGEIRWRALTDNWRVRVRPDPLLEEVHRVVGGG